MAIEGISGGFNAYTASLQAGQQTQQSAQSQDTAPVEQREPKPEERVEKTEEAPPPVTNAQGQVTGTLINVTA